MSRPPCHLPLDVTLADPHSLSSPFESATLILSIWQEPHYNRTKLLCTSLPPDGRPRKNSAKYLTDLTITRTSSAKSSNSSGGKDGGSKTHPGGAWLHLTHTSKNKYWAGLRFTSLEPLIILHNLLLSLRSHDLYDPLDRIRDHRLKGEEELFEATITDDRYKHFLKLLLDVGTGTLRLQASILDGDPGLRRAPVWTGWITHLVHSPSWLRYEGGRCVTLRELTRWVFCEKEGYDEGSLQGDQGMELVFEREAEARRFVGRLEQWVEAERKRNKKKEEKQKDKKDKDSDGKGGGGGKEKDKEKGKGKGNGKKDDGKKDKQQGGGGGGNQQQQFFGEMPPVPPPAPNAPPPPPTSMSPGSWMPGMQGMPGYPSWLPPPSAGMPPPPQQGR